MVPSLISYATGCRMPYQTEREAHGIHQKFWGDLLPPELFDSLKAIPETPDFPSLRYIIKDAREAAKNAYAMGNDKKGGQYDDEAHYAAQELHKRGHGVREAKAKYDAEKSGA